MSDLPRPPPLHKMTQSTQMRLSLSKDSVGLIKSQGNVSTESSGPVHRSVIKGPTPKKSKDKGSPVDKPITIPTVPKLLTMITSNKQQSTVAQLFSSSSNSPVNKHQSSSNKSPKTQSPRPVSKKPSAVPVPLQPGTQQTPKKILPKPSETAGQSTSKKVESNAKTKATKRPLSGDEKLNGGASKPKKSKKAPAKSKPGSTSGLPLSRVRTIMKLDTSSHNTVNTGQEAVAIVAKATVSHLYLIIHEHVCL